MNKPEAETIFDLGKEATVAKLLEQDEQIKKLTKQLDSLKKYSSNSSKPPSTDGPGKKRYPKKPKPSGRKPGGQKGHRGKKREILPAEQMDQIHHLYPAVAKNVAISCLAGQAPRCRFAIR